MPPALIVAPLSRRGLVRAAGALALPLLAACGGAPAPPAASPTAAPSKPAEPAKPAEAKPPAAEPTKPAAAAQAAPTTAPSAAAPASAGQIELVIWDSANDPLTSGKNTEQVYEAYNRAQSKVRVKGVHGQGPDKILAALSAGAPPNVIFMWSGQEPLGDWAQKGLLVPLDDQIKARNFDLNQIHPAALKTCQFRGKLYGLPILADGMFLFSNVASVKEAGLDPAKPPLTWDDWNGWTTKLTKRDASGNITQLGSGLPKGWALYNVVWSFGGEAFNQEGTQVTPDHPGIIAALTFLQDWVKSVGFDAAQRFSAGLGKNVSPQNPFLLGQLPSNIDGEWTLRYIRQFKPEWQIERDFLVNPVPYPTGKAELASTMHLADYPWVIGKGAKNVDESVDWMVWTAGNKDVQADFALNQMNLATLIPALRDDRLAKAPGFGKNVQILLESKNVKALPVTPITAMFDDLFGKAVDGVVAGKEAPRDAMTKLKERLQPELDKAK
jgi:multiple sugar transport system substrate-binding protein